MWPMLIGFESAMVVKRASVSPYRYRSETWVVGGMMRNFEGQCSILWSEVVDLKKIGREEVTIDLISDLAGKV